MPQPFTPPPTMARSYTRSNERFPGNRLIRFWRFGFRFRVEHNEKRKQAKVGIWCGRGPPWFMPRESGHPARQDLSDNVSRGVLRDDKSYAPQRRRHGLGRAVVDVGDGLVHRHDYLDAAVVADARKPRRQWGVRHKRLDLREVSDADGCATTKFR